MKKVKGVSLRFGGISWMRRFRIWWQFTKAVIFKMDIETKVPVIKIIKE